MGQQKRAAEQAETTPPMVVVALRLAPADLDKIDAYASATSMRRSDAMRALMLSKEEALDGALRVRAPHTFVTLDSAQRAVLDTLCSEVAGVQRAVIGASRNWNQVARRWNSGEVAVGAEDRAAMAALHEVLERVHDDLDALGTALHTAFEDRGANDAG